ncbi:MAG TPA: DUF4147 domain-containing protein [Terriglobales bacterium]|jgi:hydroxypyruvate reductase
MVLPLDSPLAAEMRRRARGFFDQALVESSVERAFRRHLECERGVLRVREDLYDLQAFSRVFVVSIGKAAHAMVEALESRAGSRFEGIVASPLPHAAQFRGFRYFQGGHPVPTPESIRAAEAILKALTGQNAASLVIFLLSGGGSAVVEKPFDDEISADDLAAAYQALVLSGGSIAEINAIRKHLSAIKGGRLGLAAAPARQVSLLISDVPDHQLDALASGPTMPDSTTLEDCYRIAAKYRLPEQMPASVRELFEKRALEETPKSADPAFVHSRWWTLSSNGALVEAAAEAARGAGFAVTVDNSCDDWDYVRAGEYLLGRLRELRRQSPRSCLISGGEVTVKVLSGGRGGRNQQFALALAPKIAGENTTVLSAGSDGIDGNSPAAGAIVDGSTAGRAHGRGLNPGLALEKFDAYPFFEALGDAIITGPTGNNLRDLRILLAY